MSRLRRALAGLNPPLVLGGLLSLALIICALAAPLVAPFDPQRTVMVERGASLLPAPYPPGTAGMPLGSDPLRRDLLSRLIYGSRYTLLFVAVTAGLRVLIGAGLGLLGGWYARWGRALDVLAGASSAIPSLFFCLLPLALIVRAGNLALTAVAFTLVMALTGWAETAVRTRVAVEGLRGAPFVEAAYAVGVGPWGALWRHVLPNLTGLLLVEAAYAAAAVLLLNAELAFLGIYVAGAERELVAGTIRPDPLFAEWGSLMAKGVEQRRAGPWLFLGPVAAFALSILAFNLLADGLRRRRAT